jgi:hypothetical protein
MELKKIRNNAITFDYDGTLDDHFGGHEINPFKKETRDFVKRLIRRGYEISIVTRRYGPDHKNLGIGNEHLKVWETAAELGIPRERVFFTNREWKYSTIQTIGACMHIDDDDKEQYWIERHLPDVKMVLVGSKNWEESIISKIEEHDSIQIWLQNEKNIIKLGLIIATILLTVLLFV